MMPMMFIQRDERIPKRICCKKGEKTDDTTQDIHVRMQQRATGNSYLMCVHDQRDAQFL